VIKGDKLTTIVLESLSKSYKVPQSIHAVVEFSITYQQKFLNWKKGSNYLCCLETSEKNLLLLIEKLKLLNIDHSLFYEPDLNNQVTAITVEALNKDSHNYLFKNFKLTNHG